MSEHVSAKKEHPVLWIALGATAAVAAGGAAL